MDRKTDAHAQKRGTNRHFSSCVFARNRLRNSHIMRFSEQLYACAHTHIALKSVDHGVRSELISPQDKADQTTTMRLGYPQGWKRKIWDSFAPLIRWGLPIFNFLSQKKTVIPIPTACTITLNVVVFLPISTKHKA